MGVARHILAVFWFLAVVPLTYLLGSMVHSGVHISVVENERVVRVRLHSFGYSLKEAIWIDENAPGEPFKFSFRDRGVKWEWGWSGRRVDVLRAVAALS